MAAIVDPVLGATVGTALTPEISVAATVDPVLGVAVGIAATASTVTAVMSAF
jgi:hypothetical protein